MGQNITHEVNAAPLPGGRQHLRDGGLDAFMSIRKTTKLDPTQAPPRELAAERAVQKVSASDGPISMPSTSRRPSLLTPTRQQSRRRRRSGLAHEPSHRWRRSTDTASPPSIGTCEEGFHPLVDLLAEPRDLALGYAAHAERLDEIIDRARRDPLDVGLLNHGGEGFLRHPPRLQE